MASRILGSATVLVMVLVLGSALQGCGAEVTGASPAPTQAPAAKAAVAKPVKAFGYWGVKCTKYDEPPRGGKDQTIELRITDDTQPPLIKYPEPICAKESAKGSLTFQLGDFFPPDYLLEVDILPERNGDGSLRKGPYKRKGDKAKYPMAGRCWLTKAKDSCKFESDSHHSDVATNSTFRYNLTLFDAERNVVDEVDPGIMVTDNP